MSALARLPGFVNASRGEARCGAVERRAGWVQSRSRNEEAIMVRMGGALHVLCGLVLGHHGGCAGSRRPGYFLTFPLGMA